MKVIQLICALILTLTLVGCEEGEDEKSDPTANLREEIEAQRELRFEAEARAEKEAGSRSKWELAAFVLALAALAAFVSGTAIGSRAKHNAEER